MPGVYSINNSEVMRSITAEERRIDAQQLTLMNQACTEAITAGGACDQATFEFGMLGNDLSGRNFTAELDPQPELRAVLKARELRFSAGEFFVDGSVEEDRLRGPWLYVVLPSDPENTGSSPVAYSIESSGSTHEPYSFYGKAAVKCLSLSVHDAENPAVGAEVVDRMAATLYRTRDQYTASLRVSNFSEGSAVIGISAIRRLIKGNESRPLTFKFQANLEPAVARLMQRYVDLTTAPQLV